MKAPAVKATGKLKPIYICVSLETFFYGVEQICFSFFHLEGLSLLGAYEDSDEEDAGNRSAAHSQQSQPGDIDSTLANFMAVSPIRWFITLS